MGYWSFETVFCRTSQILSRFCGRIAPRPRSTIAPKSTPQKGKEHVEHLPTSDKFNPSLLNQRIHQLSKSNRRFRHYCGRMQTDSAPASARAVFAGKYGETTGKYRGLRVGEIGVNNSNDWRGGVVCRADSDEGTPADERTPPANGLTIAFVEQSRSPDGERARERGPPPTHSTRKQSGRHSQTRSKCVAFAASLPERRDAREGSYASEARTARGRQCFERMNGGIIGGLGFVCQVKSFWDESKCR